MRNISDLALATIVQQQGLQPVTIVGINWNGTEFLYSDIAVQGLLGRIIEVSEFDSVADFSGNSTSEAVTIILDDFDGAIKTIMDNVDIHKRPVIIYQWFQSINLSDKFVIFEGYIQSPISWKEGDRTLTFTAVSLLEDNEVGFAPEDGDIDSVPVSMLGKAWPMVFGTVLNLQPVQIDEIPTGSTLTAVSIPDHGLRTMKSTFNCELGKQLAIASCLSFVGATLQFEAEFEGGGRELFDRGTQFQTRSSDIVRRVNEQLMKDQSRLSRIQADQESKDNGVIVILNGNHFIQGIVIEIKIKDAIFAGFFVGDFFFVLARRREITYAHINPPSHPSLGTAPNPGSVTITDPEGSDFVADALFGEDKPAEEYMTPTEQDLKEDPCGPYNLIVSDCSAQGSFSSNNGALQLGYPDKEKHWFAQAGTGVQVGNNYPIRYVVSITPVTINNVAAFYSVHGIKILLTVPSIYYQLEVLDFGSIQATVIRLLGPLSSLELQFWDDQLYVTATSTVGPNVADVLSYIISTYSTNLTIDATTFAEARLDLVPYQANFALLQKKNLVQVLKEIAFQAGCSIWIANGTVHLAFLPKQGAIVETFTEDDIVHKSLEVTCDPTENVVTKMVCTWKQDYRLSENNKLIIKANVAKYGIHEQSFDFYIYNNYDSVNIMATFWLIRKANIFKKIRFQTFLSKLKIETLDTVMLNFNNPYVANTNIPAQITSSKLNTNDFTITMEAWIPVRFGEMVLYNNALPITYFAEYPEIFDQAGAIGPAAQAQGTLMLEASPPPSVNVVHTNKSQGSTKPADKNINPDSNNIAGQIGPPGYNLGPAIVPSPVPVYDYRFKQYEPIPRPKATFDGSTVPGQVQDKIGNDGIGAQYNVAIFPEGLDQDSVIVKATQLQQSQDTDPEEIITPNSWFLFSRDVVITSGGHGQPPNITIKYHFQAPIWQKEMAPLPT